MFHNQKLRSLLSQNLNNTYIILRYKSLNWLTNKYFKNIVICLNNAILFIFFKVKTFYLTFLHFLFLN